MTSPREIRPSLVLALALLAFPLAAVIYFKSRANDQEAMAGNRIEIAELRVQIASQTQELSELRSKMELARNELVFLKPTFASPSGPTPSVTLAELNRCFSELAAQQSNLLAAIQRSALRGIDTESPEQTRQRAEAVITVLESQYAEYQKKVEDAQAEVDTLRTNLAVPDEIAVMDQDKAVDDPRLLAYRAYFEAKRTHDELRRFGQILGMKVASEKLDLSLPRSKQ